MDNRPNVSEHWDSEWPHGHLGCLSSGETSVQEEEVEARRHSVLAGLKVRHFWSSWNLWSRVPEDRESHITRNPGVCVGFTTGSGPQAGPPAQDGAARGLAGITCRRDGALLRSARRSRPRRSWEASLTISETSLGLQKGHVSRKNRAVE